MEQPVQIILVAVMFSTLTGASIFRKNRKAKKMLTQTTLMETKRSYFNNIVNLWEKAIDHDDDEQANILFARLMDMGAKRDNEGDWYLEDLTNV